MANPSRDKGTRQENAVRDKYLRRVWPNAERAPLKGVRDVGDFTGVNGWMIESKWRKTTRAWRIASWFAALLAKRAKYDPTAPVALFVGADKRSKEGFPIDVVVVPAEQYAHQMARLRSLERMGE